MLVKALTAIDEPKPHPNLAPSIHDNRSASPTSVAEMLAILSKLKRTAELTSGIIRARTTRSGLHLWRASARQACLPARLHDAALRCFDRADTEMQGWLSRDAANGALRELLDWCSNELGEHVTVEPLAFAEPVTWRNFIEATARLPLPAGLREAAASAATGVRCICGGWLEERPRHECYPGGQVRCDFTGQSVKADTVLHCGRNRGAAVHPFGFDVAGEAREEFEQYQQVARLHDRLDRAIEEQRPVAQYPTLCITGEEHAPCGDSHELLDKLQAVIYHQRRARCAQYLYPHISNMYLSIKEDIQNATAAERPVAELKQRLDWSHRLLASQEWHRLKAEAAQSVKALLAELDELAASLSHEKLAFRDSADRAAQIEQFEKTFRPAERHAAFEGRSNSFRQLCMVAREFVGREPITEEPETEQLIDSIGEQVLQAIVQQRGMPLCLPISRSYQQTDQGVLFRWQLATPLGQTVTVEHTVPFDQHDVELAKDQRKFMTSMHELQERIKALALCATESELDSQLRAFEVETSDCADGQVCVVCQEQMCAGERALQISACGHCFHDECVRGWLLGCKHECPICKTPVKQVDEQEAADQFADGQVVQIHGLQSQPALNGTVGRIVGFDQRSGRYRVNIGGEAGRILSVMPRNLSRQPESEDEEQCSSPSSCVTLSDEDPETAVDGMSTLFDSFMEEYDEGELRAALEMSLQMDLAQVELRW